MRRILACSAAVALAAAFLLPTSSAVAKTLTCDEGMAPGWVSLGYARVPLGLSEGTHELRIDFAFTDIDGTHVVDFQTGTFEVSRAAPILPGTVMVTPWGLLAPDAPKDKYPIDAINPLQPATFALGWGNYQTDPSTGAPLSRQVFTDVIHGTTQTVSVDGGPMVPMHFRGLIQECYWLP